MNDLITIKTVLVLELIDNGNISDIDIFGSDEEDGDANRFPRVGECRKSVNIIYKNSHVLV